MARAPAPQPVRFEAPSLAAVAEMFRERAREARTVAGRVRRQLHQRESIARAGAWEAAADILDQTRLIPND